VYDDHPSAGRRRRLGSRFNYANVMATVALVVALGGGAYAASQLPKNSVGSKQLKKSAVKTKQLAKDAVTGAKVRDGSLASDDFAPGSLPQGPKGEPGEPGKPGPPGPTASTYASTGTQITLPNAGSVAYVLRLDPANGDSLGPLELDFDARVNVSATVTFDSGAGTGTDAQPFCQLELTRLGGVPADIGQSAAVEIEGNSNHDEEETLALLATIDRPPGTYDVAVVCGNALGAGVVDAEHVSIQVIATAR
jgi:hypothetical protein